MFCRSEAARPQQAITEFGDESLPPASVLEDRAYQQDAMSPMSRQYSNQDDMPLFGVANGHFDALAGVGEGPFADPFDGTQALNSRRYSHRSVDAPNGLSVLGDAALHLTSPVDSILTSPAVYHNRIPSIRVDEVGLTDSITALNQMHQDTHSHKRIKTEWGARATMASNSQDNLNANRTESGEFACPECPKIKKRECDLR